MENSCNQSPIPTDLFAPASESLNISNLKVVSTRLSDPGCDHKNRCIHQVLARQYDLQVTLTVIRLLTTGELHEVWAGRLTDRHQTYKNLFHCKHRETNAGQQMLKTLLHFGLANSVVAQNIEFLRR
jgi:hypothetical protein